MRGDRDGAGAELTIERHNHDISAAHAGDWLEVNGIAGALPRRGEILEVLGHVGHTHFRVRWDEGHESIVYPVEHQAAVHPARSRR